MFSFPELLVVAVKITRREGGRRSFDIASHQKNATAACADPNINSSAQNYIRSSKAMVETLRVITLNCWGLKYLSKARNERLTQIGTEIANANPQPQIVGLQECWTQQDYKAIREKTQHILPYGKFYYSGAFGGGLAILSKWYIEESSMVPYKLNGRPTAFFRGDWFVGKGVACAKIRIGNGRTAEVFCTHVRLICQWPDFDIPNLFVLLNIFKRSCTLPMKKNQTILIYAIGLPKLGRSQNLCALRTKKATSCSVLEIST